MDKQHGGTGGVSVALVHPITRLGGLRPPPVRPSRTRQHPARIRFSSTRRSKFFSRRTFPALCPTLTGPGSRPHPPPSLVRRNRRGDVPPLLCRCLREGIRFGGIHPPRDWASEVSTRHPHREGECAESAARRKVFGRSRSISPRRCSLPALRVAPRETSHLELTPDCYSAGVGIRANPRAGPLCDRISQCDRSPLVVFAASPAWGKNRKTPESGEALRRFFVPLSPSFRRGGRNWTTRPFTALGPELHARLIVCQR